MIALLALSGLVGSGLVARPAAAAPAGPEVWLNPTETAQLRQNVRSKPHVARAWQLTRSKADAALDDAANPPNLANWVPENSLTEVYGKGCADAEKALALGYAWKVTGERRYADKVKFFLGSWATSYGSPPWPIRHQVDEAVPMMTFALAYDMVKTSPSYNDAERTAMQAWFAKFVARGKTLVRSNWEHNNAYPGGDGQYANGIAWAMGQVALSAAAANDVAAVHWATDQHDNMSEDSVHFTGRTYNLQRFIAEGIRDDGSTEDEHIRQELANGQFQLQPIAVTASAVDDYGIDLWGYEAEGHSLEPACEHFAPYLARQLRTRGPPSPCRSPGAPSRPRCPNWPCASSAAQPSPSASTGARVVTTRRTR